MQLFLPLFKREFFGYFRSPVAYVFIVIFLLASSGCTFFLSRLYESNQASLDSFFGILPWLFLVLVPAVGMRLWAEERHSGTIELLFTLPVNMFTAVFAKYMAALSFLVINLMLTFPIVITVNYLGQPDNGVILISYFGSVLLAGSCLSISCLTSALTKNQVVSFILGVMITFLLVLLGWGVFTNVLAAILPISIVDMITSLGLIPHYTAITRGVVDSRDVIYFVLLSGASLVLTAIVLELKKEG